MSRYTFTQDFNVGGGSFSNISHLVNNYGIPNTIVEVGIFEGSTTFWLADQLVPLNSNLKIYSIDPHVGSIDMQENFNDVKEMFLKNLNNCKHKKNISYISKHSFDGLIKLISENINAQIVYIDGDHRAGGVMEDLVLAWRVLDVGGVILCDDTTTWKYVDKNGTFSAHMSPRLAVESFIQCNWDKLKILSLPDGSQTGFMKIKK